MLAVKKNCPLLTKFKPIYIFVIEQAGFMRLYSECVWEREDCMCMRAGFDEGVYIVRFNLFSPYILHKKMLIFFKIEHMICDEQR